MRDLLPALTIAAIWITGVLLIMWRQRVLERRRAERARRRRILRYLATTTQQMRHAEIPLSRTAHAANQVSASMRDFHKALGADVVPLDTYSRKV